MNAETIEEQSNLSDSCISSDTLLDDEEFLEDDENEEAWELDSSKACCSRSQNDSDSNKDLNDDDRKDTDSTSPSTHLGETQQAAQPPPTINPLFDILTNEQHKQLTHIKQVQMLDDTERQQRLKELADDSSKVCVTCFFVIKVLIKHIEICVILNIFCFTRTRMIMSFMIQV
jgi:hypothetical protein